MACNSLLTVLGRAQSLMNGPNGNFLDLSVMFLLPLAFFLSTVVYPALLDFYTNPFLTIPVSSSELQQSQPAVPDMTVFTFIAFLLYVSVTSLLAVGSITHSASHGFHDRPVRLTSAIKSGLASFFPLLGTLVVSQVVDLLILKAFGQFVSMIGPFHFIFMAFSVVSTIALLLYLQVMWSLAFAVVVVEPSWGFGALLRSWRLVKGMRVRGVAFSMMLLHGVFSAMLGFLSWVLEMGSEAAVCGWKSWAIAVLLGLTTILQMMVLLCYGVAITILYCKAANGEEEEVVVVSDPMECVILALEDDEKGSASAGVVPV
ncbi:uncharacterized protein Pyn_39803 [Prunus yedoensis var. nudiflora]|uniref:Uncharacterized protein n=1 Tax=Prunus yedoensis var. nudiflora TaxID=2094558 RepID=A0A314UD77_PRUYE|nr:uncharacterized protein Pyn_39803 [Prunus yedoensis var. nudiflora]